jgi:hypothetical protein
VSTFICIPDEAEKPTTLLASLLLHRVNPAVGTDANGALVPEHLRQPGRVIVPLLHSSRHVHLAVRAGAPRMRGTRARGGPEACTVPASGRGVMRPAWHRARAGSRSSRTPVWTDGSGCRSAAARGLGAHFSFPSADRRSSRQPVHLVKRQSSGLAHRRRTVVSVPCGSQLQVDVDHHFN